MPYREILEDREPSAFCMLEKQKYYKTVQRAKSMEKRKQQTNEMTTVWQKITRKTRYLQVEHESLRQLFNISSLQTIKALRYGKIQN